MQDYAREEIGEPLAIEAGLGYRVSYLKGSGEPKKGEGIMTRAGCHDRCVTGASCLYHMAAAPPSCR